MSDRNTVIRSMHDLGAAGWFGGSLVVSDWCSRIAIAPNTSPACARTLS